MIRRLLVLLLLAVAAGPFTGCAYYNTMYHADKSYDEAMKEVEKSHATGQTNASAGVSKFNLCIEKCQKMLDVHGGSKWADDAHFLMGRAYYGKGDYLSARRQFERFRGRYPNSDLLPKAMFWTGLTDLALGEPDAARETWNDLLAKYPKYDGSEEVEFQLAEVLRTESNYPEAVEAYRSFLQAHPKDQRANEARLSLGAVLLEEGEYAEAAQEFGEVAANGHEERQRLQAKLDLGEAFERQQRFDDALAIYTELEYRFDPNYLDGRMTPEERAAIRQQQQELLVQARADSVFNASFENPDDPNRTRQPVDPNDPYAGQNGINDPNDPYQQGNPNLNDPLPQNQVNGQTQQGLPGTVNGQPNATNSQGNEVQQQMQQMGRIPLPRTDPHYEDLARVYLREGRARAAMGKPWEAILAFEQVIAEYPNTEFAAEAQYRIGYTQEVDLEDYAEAEKAYKAVAGQGRTSAFAADADSRARNLNTLRSVTAADTSNAAASEDVNGRFVKAELYIYQQDRPQKAIDEYLALQQDFPGTETAAKATLAEAYVRFHVLADTARGRAKYAEVMTRYPDTPYGHFATRLLKGPEKEPKPQEFVGPSLTLLLAQANLEAIAKENEMVARLTAPPDTTGTEGQGSPELAAAVAAGGAAMGLAAAPGGPAPTGGIDPLRLPDGGPSPILNDAQRAGGVTRRVEAGFMPPVQQRPTQQEYNPDHTRAFVDSLVAARDSIRAAVADTVAAPPDTTAQKRPRGPRAGPPPQKPPPAPADTTGSHDGGR